MRYAYNGLKNNLGLTYFSRRFMYKGLKRALKLSKKSIVKASFNASISKNGFMPTNSNTLELEAGEVYELTEPPDPKYKPTHLSLILEYLGIPESKSRCLQTLINVRLKVRKYQDSNTTTNENPELNVPSMFFEGF